LFSNGRFLVNFILPQVINKEAVETQYNIVYFRFKGGERLKFGDVVTCVASIAVIDALIAVPLEMVFVSVGLGFELGQNIGAFVAFFLSALISGYIFAGKIWEARRETITKITVLWAALVSLIATIVPAGVTHWGLVSEEKFREKFPGINWTTLSNAERMSWEMMNNAGFLFLIVGMALVLGFIGLYVGSTLRKPAKNQK